jgi:hypothetical protein
MSKMESETSSRYSVVVVHRPTAQDVDGDGFRYVFLYWLNQQQFLLDLVELNAPYQFQLSRRRQAKCHRELDKLVFTSFSAET